MNLPSYLDATETSANSFAFKVGRILGHPVAASTITRLANGETRDPSLGLALAINEASDGQIGIEELLHVTKARKAPQPYRPGPPFASPQDASGASEEGARELSAKSRFG